MGLRSFAILAAIVCTACGSAGVSVKIIVGDSMPEKNVSMNQGQTTPYKESGSAEEITVADMECPPVDVAGSHLAANLGAGCSKASHHPPTAVVADTRPNNPTGPVIPIGPDDSNRPVAISGLPHMPTPAKELPSDTPVAGGTINKPPTIKSPVGGMNPLRPPALDPNHCKAEPVENAAAGSMENNDPMRECETPQPTQPPIIDISPINITEQIIISSSPVLPAAGAVPSGRLQIRPTADTSQ